MQGEWKEIKSLWWGFIYPPQARVLSKTTFYIISPKVRGAASLLPLNSGQPTVTGRRPGRNIKHEARWGTRPGISMLIPCICVCTPHLRGSPVLHLYTCLYAVSHHSLYLARGRMRKNTHVWQNHTFPCPVSSGVQTRERCCSQWTLKPTHPWFYSSFCLSIALFLNFFNLKSSPAHLPLREKRLCY